MRRRSSSTNLFGWIIKDLVEAKQGKLRKSSAGYIFSDKGCTNNQGYHLPAIVHEVTNKLISLEIRPYIRNCPVPPYEGAVEESRSHRTERGYYWVREAACKKCQYRLKKACCAKLREERREDNPAKQFGEMLGEATKKANELLGR